MHGNYHQIIGQSDINFPLEHWLGSYNPLWSLSHLERFAVFSDIFARRAVLVPHEFPRLEIFCLRSPRHPGVRKLVTKTSRNQFNVKYYPLETYEPGKGPRIFSIIARCSLAMRNSKHFPLSQFIGFCQIGFLMFTKITGCHGSGRGWSQGRAQTWCNLRFQIEKLNSHFKI